MLFPSRDSNSVRESLKIFVLSRGSNIVYEKEELHPWRLEPEMFPSGYPVDIPTESILFSRLETVIVYERVGKYSSCLEVVI